MKTKAVIIGVAVIAISVGAWLVFDRPRRADPEKVKVAIGTWAGFGNAIVGRDADLFPGIKVELSIVDDPTVLSSGLGKDYMVIQSSMDYAAQMLANGLDGQVILITDESAGGDAIITDSHILTIEQLTAKRVGFTAGPASEWLLVGALEKHNMSMKDIKYKDFTDPLAARDAYVGGDLDALVIWEPFIAQAKTRRQSNTMISSRELPERVFGVLIASRSMLKNHELMGRFLRGWFEADQYRISHHEAATEMIGKALQTTPEDTRQMLDGTKIASSARNRYYFVGNGKGQPPLQTLMEKALAYWKSKGDVKQEHSLSEPISSMSIDFFRNLR